MWAAGYTILSRVCCLTVWLVLCVCDMLFRTCSYCFFLPSMLDLSLGISNKANKVYCNSGFKISWGWKLFITLIMSGYFYFRHNLLKVLMQGFRNLQNRLVQWGRTLFIQFWIKYSKTVSWNSKLPLTLPLYRIFVFPFSLSWAMFCGYCFLTYVSIWRNSFTDLMKECFIECIFLNPCLWINKSFWITRLSSLYPQRNWLVIKSLSFYHFIHSF